MSVSVRVYRSTKRVINTPQMHVVGDGFFVHNFAPFGLGDISSKEISPFYLLDYGPRKYFEPRKRQRGVGPHPHRGLETVSLLFEGEVEHLDSNGDGGIIRSGDLQWMTAGNGLLHREYHSSGFTKNGGYLHFVQLWVNLPKKFKTTPSKYQPIVKKDIPVLSITKSSKVSVIAGDLLGTKGIASTFSPIILYIIEMDANDVFELPVRNDHNIAILVIDGPILVNEQNEKLLVKENHLILFNLPEKADSNESFIRLCSVPHKTRVIVFGGEPINEPICGRGPFLMNYEKEIGEAWDDFYSGKFGHLNDVK